MRLEQLLFGVLQSFERVSAFLLGYSSLLRICFREQFELSISFLELRSSFLHLVFELALRYLGDHTPKARITPRLVHGDYRMGNLMIGPEGLRAVLDWELCHIGDPMQDLAWLCIPPWRFGKIDSPAGGLGSREALYSGYENATGERIDRARLRYWEVFGSLR